MGMGEPLANLDRLLPALAVASSPQGLGIGQRRIRAVGHADSFTANRLSMQSDGHVIALHAGRHIKVDHRLDTERIAEGNVSAFQPILCAIEEHIAFGNVHPSHNGWPRSSAAYAQIKIAGKLGQRRFHLQLRRGSNVHVQAHVIQKWIQSGDDWRFFTLRQVVGKIKMRIHTKPGNQNIAGEQ